MKHKPIHDECAGDGDGEPLPPSRPLEFDALHSILRALEPLTHEQRVRVVAAARCFFDAQAAARALELEYRPEWWQQQVE
jgi:hypothetical protein